MIGEFIKTESDLNLKTNMGVNDINYQRKTTMIPFKACIIAKNNVVCELEGKQQTQTYDITTNFYNDYYKISFWEQKSNIGTISSVVDMVGTMIKDKSIEALGETMLPKIYDNNGNQVGKIEYVPVKKEKMQSYYYYKLYLNDIELKCYIIGHGKEEILFVMYDKNENIVATVSKRMKVKNAKARYTMYIEDESWFKYVAIATISIHQMVYDNEEEKITLGSQGHSLNTYQKELLDKYDPNFIPNVISQEEEANLPENMPLVQEKVKESQSTFILNYRRISLIIFIIFFIMLIFFFFNK